MISREDVDKLGELSRIGISDDEKEELISQLDNIVEYISQIQEIAGEDDDPAQARDYRHLVNTGLRDDDNAHESGLYTEVIMKEVPDTADGYLKVKKILG